MQAYDALPGFDHLPLPIRAFAFWSVPSLKTLYQRRASPVHIHLPSRLRIIQKVI
jgi:hypothetical protein